MKITRKNLSDDTNFKPKKFSEELIRKKINQVTQIQIRKINNIPKGKENWNPNLINFEDSNKRDTLEYRNKYDPMNKKLFQNTEKKVAEKK